MRNAIRESAIDAKCRMYRRGSPRPAASTGADDLIATIHCLPTAMLDAIGWNNDLGREERDRYEEALAEMAFRLWELDALKQTNQGKSAPNEETK